MASDPYTIFCYIIGLEGVAFSVKLPSSATIDELKDAIKDKKKETLKKLGIIIAADELTLWRASPPFLVDELDDGTTKLSWISEDNKKLVYYPAGNPLRSQFLRDDKKTLRTRADNLLKARKKFRQQSLEPPSASIGKFFVEEDFSVKEVVHVLVELPGQVISQSNSDSSMKSALVQSGSDGSFKSNSGGDQDAITRQASTVPSGSDSDLLFSKCKDLYALLWGAGDLDHFIDEDVEKHGRYFDFKAHSLSWEVNRLFIRKEYEITLGLLEKEAEYDKCGGMVIGGHPGIGKSMSLVYFLLHRLCKKLPTAYQVVEGSYILFNENGVTQRSDAYVPASEGTGKHRTFSLFDSNAKLQTISGGFLSRHSNHFAVQATSPRIARYKDWSKERIASFVMMDVWSWEEMEQFALVQGLDCDLVGKIYRTWGPSARLCHNLKSVDEFASEIHRSSSILQTQIRQILLEIAQTNDEQGSKTIGVPHNIFWIRPCKPHSVERFWYPPFSIYIPTGALRVKCFRALISAEILDQQTLFDMLSTNPQSRSTAGYILEKWMHLHFVKDQWLKPETSQGILEVECYDNSGTKFLLQTVASLPILFDSNFSEASLGSSGLPPYYILPTRSNQVTFDAVIVTAEEVIILQATVAEKHPINRKGVDALITLLPSRANRNFTWRFVYYVHDHATGQKLVKKQDLRFKNLNPLRRMYAVCPLSRTQPSKEFLAKIDIWTEESWHADTPEEQEELENNETVEDDDTAVEDDDTAVADDDTDDMNVDTK